MSFEISIPIAAPLEQVWATTVDVEAWPRSTASITSVERLDSGPFQMGSRARVKQPKLPPLVWQVTEFQPLQSFSWQTRSPGSTTIGTHRVSPNPETGGVTLTLRIDRHGPLAPLVNLFTDKLTRQYVTMEAQGMKRVCEAASAPHESLSRG
jgi:uncharacterized membrane protein